MRITKNGRSVKREKFTGTCAACGCEIEAEKIEAEKVEKGEMEQVPSPVGERFVCPCPWCGKGMFVERDTPASVTPDR